MERTKNPTIYVDMDGVTADFDSHYIATVGPLPERDGIDRDVDWKAINGFEFFLTMPPMPDAHELWGYLAGRSERKVLLTGIPSTGTERAAHNKQEWAKRQPFIPKGTDVVCTRSKEKWHHCKPGDVLIDDWVKYKDLWIKAGGLWITHTSAKATIEELRYLIL